MKYKKRSDNIFNDFEFYCGRESLYGLFFGFKLTKKQRQKANYIWKRLLIEHKKILGGVI